MSNQLCAAPGCTSRGYHWSDCAGDCGGCQPRLAADGLRLCRRCTEGIAIDARHAATLHAELAQRLSGSGAPGEKTSGSRNPGLTLNDRAAEVRTLIRNVLVSWTRLIAEERGFALPNVAYVQVLPLGFIGPPRLLRRVDESAAALGEFIARSAEWLAAHPAAGEAAGELRDLVHSAYPVAYPSGTRFFDVAPCLVVGCTGTIRAVVRRVDSLLPSALVCSEDDGHTWPASEWLTLGRQLDRQRRAA